MKHELILKIIFKRLFFILILNSQYILAKNVVVLATTPNAPYHKILSDIPISNRIIMVDGSNFSKKDLLFYKKFFKSVINVQNYLNSSEVEANIYKLCLSKEVNRIVAAGEFDILRAARIRDHFNLPGQSYESAVAFRDKIKMKQLLESSGIEVPVYRKVNNIFDVLDFVKEYGYPIIVKPIRGSGATRTIKANNANDLKKLSEKGYFNADYVSDLEVEQFIEGDMYHIDGLVVNGNIVIVHPSKYIGQCLDVTENYKNIGSFMLDDKNPVTQQLKDYSKKVLKALPTPENTAFHLEVFKERKSGRLIFCEIASRVGGGYVREDFIEGFGIDLGTEHIRLSAGLEVGIQFKNLPKKPKKFTAWIEFPKREGIVKFIPDQVPFKWVNIYRPKVQIGEILSNPRIIIDNTATIHFFASSEREASDRYHILSNWFNSNFQLQK